MATARAEFCKRMGRPGATPNEAYLTHAVAPMVQAMESEIAIPLARLSAASLRSVQRPRHSKLVLESRDPLDSTLDDLERHTIHARLGRR